MPLTSKANSQKCSRRRSRLAFAGAVALSVLSMLGLPSSVTAQPPELVTMDFSDGIQLNQAVEFILRDRDVNLVTGEELNEVVRVKLTGVGWREALRSLLTLHNYTFFEDEGILRVMKAQAADASVATGRVPVILQLLHIDAEVAKKALQPVLSPDTGSMVVVEGSRGLVSIIDQPDVIDVVKRLIQEIDVPPANVEGEISENEDGTIQVHLRDYPLSSLPTLLASALKINVFVEGALSGNTTADLDHVRWQDFLRLVLTERGFGFREDNGVVMIGEAARVSAQRVTRQFRLKYLDAIDLAPYVQGLVSDGDKVSVYSPAPRQRFEFGSKVSEPRGVQNEEGVTRRSKVIAVTARPDTLAVVEERLAELDIQPRRIEIDVKVVQITLNEDRQTGIDWNAVLSITGAVRPTTLPFDPLGDRLFPGEFPTPPTGFLFGQVRADQLSAVLRLVQENSDTEIISEPNIATLDNVEARILIGSRFPVTSETIDSESGIRTVTLDYYEDIGIQLNVIPSLCEGDRVHMIIHPAVSTLGELVQDRFPVINTREADTQVLLRSGETAVIGGLIEHQETETVRSVPILSKIPLLGRLLFSHVSKADAKTELVIFVTPRVILEGDNALQSALLPPERIQALRALQRGFDQILESQ